MAAVSVENALEQAVARLVRAGIDRAPQEARVLLAHVTGLDRARQIADPDRPLDDEAQSRFKALVTRRVNHEPVSYLIGEREFWSLPYHVGSAVLDPRPDSETLVEAALDRYADSHGAFTVLDLGTGSGCLLLTVLKSRPLARGYGVDVSPDALRVAVRNAARLGVAGRADFLCANWCDSLTGLFDLILCNPPYIATGDLTGLSPEVVRHEPRCALDGGGDGLAAYRAVAPEFRRLLSPDGLALLEIGAGQAEDVALIIENAGLSVSRIYQDLSGIQRCLAVTR